MLTQARPELIERTFEAIEGAPRAIVHLYNSTSDDAAARRLPARPGRDHRARRPGHRALQGARRSATETEIVFQYSPESFHHTELDYALEICEAVADEWGPTPEREDDRQPADDRRGVPAERLRRPDRVVQPHFSKRDSAIISRPPAQRPRHRRRDGGARPDGRRRAGRGHAVRQRRAHRQRRPRHARAQPAHAGRRPRARPLASIDEARRIVEECNELPVHPRHPYVGELVYTAFSGSHQDAIKKGMDAQERSGSERLGRAVPADRPEGRRARLRGDHPRQLAVGEGRRRVPDGDRAPPRAAARAPGRLRAEGAGDHRRARRRADRRRADGRVPRALPRRHRAVRARLVHARERGRGRSARRAARATAGRARS